jgi:hypothetical protein
MLLKMEVKGVFEVKKLPLAGENHGELFYDLLLTKHCLL